MEIHLQAAVKPHLDLACAKLNSTREELKISQEATNNLSGKVLALENQLTRFQKTFDLQRLAVDKVKDAGKRIDALGQKLDTFDVQLKELEDKVKTKGTLTKSTSSLSSNLRMNTLTSSQGNVMPRSYAPTRASNQRSFSRP